MIHFLNKTKKSIYHTLIKFDPFLVKICYRNVFFANIYYFFFSRSFYREHKAVLSGKAKYLEDLKSDTSSYYQLVRNTHRLEKGLLMKPRRPVFALNYIVETVESFEKVWLTVSDINNPQLYWFQDVLSKYFEVTEPDELISKQEEKFKNILKERKLLEKRDYSSIPYKRNRNSAISYDDFFALTRQRRSVRWFLDKEIPRELIDKAILAASQAPSACNRQPFFYKVIDDPELVKEVANYPMGTHGYSHSIKTFIVVVGNLDAYYSERDRHLIYRCLVSQYEFNACFRNVRFE